MTHVLWASQISICYMLFAIFFQGLFSEIFSHFCSFMVVLELGFRGFCLGLSSCGWVFSWWGLGSMVQGYLGSLELGIPYLYKHGRINLGKNFPDAYAVTTTLKCYQNVVKKGLLVPIALIENKVGWLTGCYGVPAWPTFLKIFSYFVCITTRDYSVCC